MFRIYDFHIFTAYLLSEGILQCKLYNKFSYVRILIGSHL